MLAWKLLVVFLHTYIFCFKLLYMYIWLYQKFRLRAHMLRVLCCGDQKDPCMHQNMQSYSQWYLKLNCILKVYKIRTTWSLLWSKKVLLLRSLNSLNYQNTFSYRAMKWAYVLIQFCNKISYITSLKTNHVTLVNQNMLLGALLLLYILTLKQNKHHLLIEVTHLGIIKCSVAKNKEIGFSQS